MNAAPSESDTRRMQCMEVWGGNTAAETGVEMLGLDAWVYSRPWQDDEAGGDVHYVSSCATGRITRFVLADVSGHGRDAADSSSTLRSTMRRFVNHIDQRRFVGAMNDAFREHASEGRFATAVVGSYFAPTNTLSVTRAGHPPALVFRAEDERWSLLDDAAVDDDHGGEVTDLPLGIQRGSYSERRTTLLVGDLLLCYSDSLIESRRADGTMLGLGGLLELVADLDARRPETVIPTLLQRVGAYGNADLDDVTVLLFRPNELDPPVPLLKNLAAPLRIIGASVASLLPGGAPAPWPELSLANIGGALWSRLNGRRPVAGSRPFAGESRRDGGSSATH